LVSLAITHCQAKKASHDRRRVREPLCFEDGEVDFGRNKLKEIATSVRDTFHLCH